jgi:hypothetical protein
VPLVGAAGDWDVDDTMATPESRRHDLYAGLARVLGEQGADTLMAHLPRGEALALATTSDFADLEVRLGARIDRIDRRIDQIDRRIDRLEGRMDERFDSVNGRLDRLFLMLGAGLLTIVGTLVAGIFFG